MELNPCLDRVATPGRSIFDFKLATKPAISGSATL